MAQDRTEIVNRALTELAKGRVMALSDAAEGARVMNAVYNGERDTALASANWLFAKQKFRPQQDLAAPLFGFRYSYTIPETCLRLIEIRDIFVGSPSLGPTYIGESDRNWWEREGDQIHTDFGAPLNCSGVFRVDNEALWDPLFIQYFVMCLAIAGFNALTRKGAQPLEQLLQRQQRAKSMAVRGNAIQEPPQELPDDSWIMSRVGP
jgi:hypothetical protein